jgi:hypothetical protein
VGCRPDADDHDADAGGAAGAQLQAAMGREILVHREGLLAVT